MATLLIRSVAIFGFCSPLATVHIDTDASR